MSRKIRNGATFKVTFEMKSGEVLKDRRFIAFTTERGRKSQITRYINRRLNGNDFIKRIEMEQDGPTYSGF